MTNDLPCPAASKKSYLRTHGLAILYSSVLSSIVTVVVVLGIQGHLATVQTRRLEASLLGKWELLEANPPRRSEIKAEEEWVEFRPDGSLLDRSITTIAKNGKLTDQVENLQVFAYQVVDGNHYLLNPGGSEHLIRVVLVGDELTLHKQFGGVERYRRAAR